jgi:hypothetical protein
MALRISGGTTYILAHCVDGHVYSTTDGTVWTSIDSGLSATVAVGWVQYHDKVYYCDGANAMRSWDGTTKVTQPTTDQADVQTVSVTGTPTGGTFLLTHTAPTGTSYSATINFDSTAAQMKTALLALTSIGTGNVTTSGGPLPGTPIVVTFAGALTSRLQPVMTTTDSFTGGTTPASHVAHTTPGFASVPIGNILAIWRNRLFIAVGRRVFWSVAADPVSFINKLNYVDFPADTAITAMCTVQNIVETPDGADGVIVFTESQMHRIYDDSDNITGVVTGGANVLVDNAVGCVGRRTIADMQSSILFLARDGVYSTNGHGGARLESVPIEPLLNTFSWGQADTFVATNYRGRYYLSYAPTGVSENSRMLEVYADLPRRGAATAQASRRYGWYEWMAHDIAVSSYLTYETDAGTIAYIAHANPGDEAYVRKLFTGGYDVTGASTPNAIRATARTGALLLGSNAPKRIRMASMAGLGNITLSVSADLDTAAGESRQFDMRNTNAPVWGAITWGQFTWGAGGGALTDMQYYTKRGRHLTFQVTESSTDSGFNDRALGYVGAARGGAAVYSLILKVTPLDAE